MPTPYAERVYTGMLYFYSPLTCQERVKGIQFQQNEHSIHCGCGGWLGIDFIISLGHDTIWPWYASHAYLEEDKGLIAASITNPLSFTWRQVGWLEIMSYGAESKACAITQAHFQANIQVATAYAMDTQLCKLVVGFAKTPLFVVKELECSMEG